MSGAGTCNLELAEHLLDLQHDLGKYLRLPLDLLPATATPDQVREAVRTALHATRRGAGRAVGARALWQAFLDAASDDWRDLSGAEALQQAVERALAWEAAVEAGEMLDRARVHADFAAVGAAIRGVGG